MQVQFARAQRRDGFSSASFSDCGMIERGKLPAAPQDAAIDDDRVDVARLRERDQRLIGIADRRDIDVAGAHEDQIGALARRERAGAVGDAEIDRAVDRGELDQPLGSSGIARADAMLMQRRTGCACTRSSRSCSCWCCRSRG